MTSDISSQCNGLEWITSLRLDVNRAVESQEQIATANLVDTLEEQVILHQSPFDKCEDQLASPTDYSATQQLGGHMRNAGIEAFLYLSARDKNKGINAAIFNPKAIRSRRLNRLTQWLCSTTNDEVVFRNNRTRDELYPFKKEEFCLSGKLPIPAL